MMVRRHPPLLTFAAMALLLLVGAIALWWTHFDLHDQNLVVIRTRIGRLDVDYPPERRTTIWWQEPDEWNQWAAVGLAVVLLPMALIVVQWHARASDGRETQWP